MQLLEKFHTKLNLVYLLNATVLLSVQSVEPEADQANFFFGCQKSNLKDTERVGKLL